MLQTFLITRASDFCCNMILTFSSSFWLVSNVRCTYCKHPHYSTCVLYSLNWGITKTSNIKLPFKTVFPSQTLLDFATKLPPIQWLLDSPINPLGNSRYFFSSFLYTTIMCWLHSGTGWVSTRLPPIFSFPVARPSSPVQDIITALGTSSQTKGEQFIS